MPTISDDPVVRRGRKRAEIAKKYEAVKQPHVFRRKGESSVGGADNRTCKDERSEDGIANAVRECRDMDISRHVSVTISDDPVVRRGRKRAEIAKKQEAVKQPRIFSPKRRVFRRWCGQQDLNLHSLSTIRT